MHRRTLDLTPAQRQTLSWFALGLAAFLLLWLLAPVLTPFVTAAVLAYALEPGVRWLRARRVPRVIAVLLVIVVAILAMIGVLLILLPIAQSELQHARARLPALVTAITEQTLPTLLNDLDERGLLETTLVVWMGEFGRTPKINANISRDHWPQCYTTLLAGGGVKAGYVYGASDETGAKPITMAYQESFSIPFKFFRLKVHPDI